MGRVALLGSALVGSPGHVLDGDATSGARALYLRDVHPEVLRPAFGGGGGAEVASPHPPPHRLPRPCPPRLPPPPPRPRHSRPRFARRCCQTRQPRAEPSVRPRRWSRLAPGRRTPRCPRWSGPGPPVAPLRGPAA